MSVTKIEWTDVTWNPTRGCSVVSPGCTNCYAMKQAHRHSGPGGSYEGLTKATRSGPQWTGEVRLVESALSLPLRWRKPRRIFVNSMSDLFHESLPDRDIVRVLDVIRACVVQRPGHVFQVLTKRPERMRDVMLRLRFGSMGGPREGEAWLAADPNDREGGYCLGAGHMGCSGLTNLWLGVSVEDQARADERIPLLLQTPAAVRFLSVEPLLGPVDLEGWLHCAGCGYTARDKAEHGDHRRCPSPSPTVDWVIVGGESGHGARPCNVAWIRDIVRQCEAAGVACFVKQLGAFPSEPCPACTGRGPRQYGEDRCHSCMETGSWIRPQADRKGGDPSEWSEDLRVREFPR